MMRNLLQNKYFLLLSAILWTSIIFWGCSMPGKNLPSVHPFPHFDKIIHFTFFFVFYIRWYLFCPRTKFYSMLLILLSVLYGFGIEYYQMYFVIGRSFDVWDGVFDTLGAVLAFLVVSRKSKVVSIE